MVWLYVYLHVEFNIQPFRWCQHVCQILPDSVDLPLQLTNQHGDEVEMMKDTAIIWPWDFFSYLWGEGKFLQWVADNPKDAGERTTEYWKHCENLDFFQRIGLPPERFGSCVPLFFHTDGVKIYKNQKAWVYSISSACRKGQSILTKMVFILVREAMIIKGKSHDAIGKIVGYIVDTLMTGKFPTHDHLGCKFPLGSKQDIRAGQAFAGGWSMAFAGFKGDWEARAIVHKLTRYYRTTFICEHCMASYKPEFTFADFTPNANSQLVRFSHDDFLMLNPPADQSSWLCVKGWTKDRNLEDAYTSTCYEWMTFR